jgi:hypothetical protein
MSILMSIILVLSCEASSLDEKAQMLLSTKDLKTLKIKINSFNESEKLRAHCNFELSNARVPTSCYKLKLSQDRNEVIDKACEKASYIMKEEVPLRALSSKCLSFVAKKNKDLRYSKEEKSPEKYILKPNNQF